MPIWLTRSSRFPRWHQTARATSVTTAPPFTHRSNLWAEAHRWAAWKLATLSGTV